MRVSTTDPITGHDVTDLDNSPFIVDGDLKVFFESEDSKRIFLELETENPAKDLPPDLSNPAGMGPGDTDHVNH